MNISTWRKHVFINRLQSFLLIAVLLGLGILTGSVLLGTDGIWLALGATVFVLLFEPLASWRLTLSLYRARPIAAYEAPRLLEVLAVLAERAELPSTPVLYYIPSPLVNAFAVGRKKRSGIALTDGLLSRLTLRELAGVMAHEVAHIAHGDLRVMSLADFISRLTHLFSIAGQFFLFFSISLLLFGAISFEINWLAVLVLVFAPQWAVLAQLSLSRTREYDADLKAAALTGDPLGLAQALAHIERLSKPLLAFLIPGWRNPEPSWLRTHPSTEERIRRLKELAPSRRLSLWTDAAGPVGFIELPVSRSPRWYVWGIWR